MHVALMLMQNSPDPEQIQKIMLAVFTIMPFLILIGLAIIILPFWFICKKAGFSPWLSLLNIVPMGGVILWYVLAFAEWKVVPAPPALWPGQPPHPPQPPYPPQA